MGPGDGCGCTPSAGVGWADRAATEHGPSGPRAESWSRSIELHRPLRAATCGVLDPLEANSAARVYDRVYVAWLRRVYVVVSPSVYVELSSDRYCDPLQG
jgi:hypothetical protein